MYSIADIQGEVGGRKPNFGGVAGIPNNGCQQIQFRVGDYVALHVLLTAECVDQC